MGAKSGVVMCCLALCCACGGCPTHIELDRCWPAGTCVEACDGSTCGSALRGWQLAHPAPTSHDLQAVWAHSPSEAWAVGSSGTILHWDGVSWGTVASPAGANSFFDIWGSDPSDVWAVGSNGVSLHWTGAAWSIVPTGTTETLMGVGGTSGRDVWAAGGHGTLLHWDGVAWTAMNLGPTDPLGAVWAASPTDAWVVARSGGRGGLWRWDGAAWNPVDLSAFADAGVPRFESAWGSAANDVWVLGSHLSLHWDGVALSSLPQTYWSLIRGGGFGGTNTWAVGQGSLYGPLDQGFIARWNGADWSPVPISTPIGHLLDVGGSSPSDVWAVGSHGTIIHWDGTRWDFESIATTTTLLGAWARTADDAWAVGLQGMTVHWDGHRWRYVANELTPWEVLQGVWAAAADDAWAVGSRGLVVHWDGAKWSRVNGGTTANLLGLWGSGATDVWAVGETGTIAHWNGSQWSIRHRASEHLTGVWGAASNDVWAVGVNGTALHWDGVSWAMVPTPTAADWCGVWGSARDHAWAVGMEKSTGRGAIMRWDGTSWTSVSVDAAWLNDVWGFGPDDVWAVGYSNALLHWDGAQWLPVAQSTAASYFHAMSGAEGSAWLVGESGTILRWVP